MNPNYIKNKNFSLFSPKKSYFLRKNTEKVICMADMFVAADRITTKISGDIISEKLTALELHFTPLCVHGE